MGQRLRRHAPEQNIRKLREAGRLLGEFDDFALQAQRARPGD